MTKMDFLLDALEAEVLECLLMPGAPEADGYHRIRVGGRGSRKLPAHRLALILDTGREPEGLVARHRCHNRACVNPRHLEWGTHRENEQDKIRAGRRKSRRGTPDSHSKITQEIADEIRARYAEGGIRQKDLAAKYGVAQSLVSGILNGSRW